MKPGDQRPSPLQIVKPRDWHGFLTFFLNDNQKKYFPLHLLIATAQTQKLFQPF
jgi:hypothetical protein